MKHWRNLLVKFLLYAVVLGLLLPAFGRAPLAEAIVSAVGLAFALYAGGDLFVLPYYGPIWAALADVGLSYLTLWGFVLLLPGLSLSRAALFFPAFVIGGVEYVFHLFLRGKAPVGTRDHPPDNPG